MKGFIKNETNRAVFKAQHGIPVNGILYFDAAYLALGDKSGKKPGPSFIKWLRDDYFFEEGWCFYKEEGVLFFKEEPVPEVKSGEPEVVVAVPKRRKVSPPRGAGKKLKRKKEASEKVNITAGAIIEADLVQAQSLITKTKDRSVLKKALTLANHFSHKEEHRRLVQRRLEEIY
jgi:hypothetical protein